jgi:hypothetical protein
MAYWLGREKRGPTVTVGPQEEAMRRFARPEIRQAHWAELAELYLVADEQPAQAILRSVALPLTGLARRAWQ